MNYTDQLTEIFDKVELLKGAAEAGLDELQQIAGTIDGRQPNKIAMLGIVEACNRADGVFELLNDLEKAIEKDGAKPAEQPAGKPTDAELLAYMHRLRDAANNVLRAYGDGAKGGETLGSAS